MPLISWQNPASRRFWATRRGTSTTLRRPIPSPTFPPIRADPQIFDQRFAKSGAGLDRVMGRPPSQTLWETLTPQRRRGVVLLLARLALRRVQGPSRLEETPDHGLGSEVG